VKLHSPAFEQVLKRGVREAIRTEPALKKEYRRTKSRRRPLWIAWISRLACSCVLAAVVAGVQKQTGHSETALVMITLWTLIATAFLSTLLSPVRLQGSEVNALRHLPVSDDTIYAYRRDNILAWHAFVFLDLLAGLGVLARLLALAWPAWLGLPVIAALAWIFNVTLAIFLAARVPRFRTGWVGFAVLFLLIIWLLSSNFVKHQMLAALDFAAPTLNLLLPTGWPLDFFHWLDREIGWLPLTGLIPIAYIIWDYRACDRIVSARYPYQEAAAGNEPPVQIPPSMAEETANGRSPGVTAIEEGILSRACLELPAWNGDWAQRMLWRWFTPSQQILAQLIFPQPLAMVRPWKRIFLHVLIAAVVLQVARTVMPFFVPAVAIFALAIPLLEVVTQSWPAGSAFRTINTFGIRISLLAPYPVSFQALSGLLLKCTFFQLPAVAVIAVGLSLAYSLSLDLLPLPAILLGLKATLVALAARLAMLVFQFSSMSNDTSRSWSRILIALAICVIEIAVGVTLAGGALKAPNQTLAWLSAFALVATQYGFLRFYGWLWNRGSIDLMSLDSR